MNYIRQIGGKKEWIRSYLLIFLDRINRTYKKIRFHQETENEKNPNNPVYPVKCEAYLTGV